MKCFAIIAGLLVFCSPLLLAQAAASDSKGGTAAPAAATKTEQTKSFQGLNFGIGLSLTHDWDDVGRIDEAEVIDGIVRVTKEKNDIPRLMLESHYFFPLGRETKGQRMYGHGPFVAIQSGSSEIIEAIGMGWMLGFRRSFDQEQSFNVGFGPIVDPAVKTLGDGIVPNQPICPIAASESTPPPCTPDLRFKETSQWGLLVMVSFGF